MTMGAGETGHFVVSRGAEDGRDQCLVMLAACVLGPQSGHLIFTY